MRSVWLEELHRQWQRARRGRAEPVASAFSRSWEQLLEDAGVTSAEDRRHAEREAGELEKEGRILLFRHRYRRHILERIRLPLDQEAWLRALFSAPDPGELRRQSMEMVFQFARRGHALYADSWRHWCEGLARDFADGKNRRPFRWAQPAAVGFLLSLTHGLTNRPWPPHTLVRDADVALDLPTKTIERHRFSLEAALAGLFQTAAPYPLELLNLEVSNSRLLFDGPLTLHFGDGVADVSGPLRHGDYVTAADLERAERITTTAERIVSVENSKTTFRRLAAANDDRAVLLIASSFPTKAVRLLLRGLPQSLPHTHFGDTDPAGYLILQKLRECGNRPVAPLQMDWRDKPGSTPLTVYDTQVLAGLIRSPVMSDLRPDLERMLASGRKGDFEQETRGEILF